VQLGVGFREYWTRIENPDKTAPQVRGDNQKMYDRLRNGLSTSQFIGYRHFGNRNLTNFYIGIELTQAWTQNRRDYNADLLGVKMVTNTDFTTGLKVGWMIPFYRKAPQKYYYY
jgi:hypothetical protein